MAVDVMSHLRIGIEHCTIRVGICIDYGMNIEYTQGEIYIDRINNIYEGILMVKTYEGEIAINISEPMIKTLTREVENLATLDKKWFNPGDFSVISTNLYDFGCTVAFNKLNIILMDVLESDFDALKEAFEFVDQLNEHFDERVWQLGKTHSEVASHINMILAFKNKLLARR